MRKALLFLGIYVLSVASLTFATACITMVFVMFSVLPDLGFPLLAAVLVLAGLCDFLLTRHALRIGCREANPVVKWLLKRFGWKTVFVLLVVLVFAAWRSSNNPYGFAVVIFYFGILANNAVGIYRKTRGLRSERKWDVSGYTTS